MKEQPYKYMVRLPPSMRELIRESARHYRRSMNSDIVARLQQSFSGLSEDAGIKEGDPLFRDDFEVVFRRELSSDEKHLIRCYRRLSGPKQAALRELLV